MSKNNDKLPWVLILSGVLILALRLIIAFFNILGMIDWFSIIVIISGLTLLVTNNRK